MFDSGQAMDGLSSPASHLLSPFQPKGTMPEPPTTGTPSAPTGVVLRPYQVLDLDDARSAIVAGNQRIVLYGPTGYGKGAVAVKMLGNAHQKGQHAIFIVDRLSLVDDMSERLDASGIPHGIIQANHPRNRPHELIQVCSAQTLEGRPMPKANLILWDECHAVRKATTERVMKSDAMVVGFTATPFTKGMSDIFDTIVGTTTTNELVRQGNLAPVRVYAAKEIDMKGAKTVAGEWSAKEVTARGTKIVCDVVDTWVQKTTEHFGGPVKTLCFSSTVKHGEEIVKAFAAKGYRFAQISYKDSNPEHRRAIIDEFKDENSTLIGLVSVEALAKGFDVPNVKVGIGCRPYRKSLSAFVQSFGRVMRASPGKEYALWLDHAGCVPRFMDDMAELFENGCSSLKGGTLKDSVHKEPTKKEKKDVTCVCGTILMPWHKACPTCGKPRVSAHSDIEQAHGKMEEVSIIAKRNKNTSVEDKAAWMGAFKGYGKSKGYKDGWSANAYKQRFGVWPNDPRIRHAAPGPMFHEAQKFVRYLQIKAANSRR